MATTPLVFDTLRRGGILIPDKPDSTLRPVPSNVNYPAPLPFKSLISVYVSFPANAPRRIVLVRSFSPVTS